MSLVINNNLMAMNATRNLNESYGKLATSTRRLSSGLRVGTAADDAAGLAMRELMRADIKTLGQGLRNANDGISMIQTADGGLGVIDAKLIRMKELAEQAATGTYTDVQRQMINQEYQLMANEITRIAQDTDFNSRKLLAGSGQEIHVEKSSHDGDATRRISTDGNTETWGYQAPALEKVISSDDTTTILGAVDSKGIQAINAAKNDDTITYTSRSGIANVVNTFSADDTDGATIDTKTGKLAGTSIDASKLNTSTYKGAKVTIEKKVGTNWADITASVDGSTHTPADNDEIRITLTKADGSVLRDTFTGNDKKFVLTKVSDGEYTIASGTDASSTNILVNSEVAISKTFNHTSKTGVETTNVATSFFEDNSASLTPASASFTHDIRTGKINEAQSVNSTASTSYGSIKTPVKEFTIETYNETTNTWEKISLGDNTTDKVNIPDSAKKFRITSEYSDNQQVRDTFSNNTGGKFTVTKTQHGLALGMTDADADGKIDAASSTQLNVKSEDLVVVGIHFGSGSQETDGYNTYINMATAKSLGVGEAAGDNITTQENAKKALDNLTVAIRRKDEIRAEIGSTQNRLSATIENVSIQRENLQASESRISDVDVATEMTEFNKVQIMTNAAVSMLAQANSLPKMAQKLLDAR